MEDWDRGVDLKGELFFSDYQKLFNYLRLNLYDRKDGESEVGVCHHETWEKGYGYRVRVCKHVIES
jgi:hypothetical protein